jgi:hypothetical protein
VVIGTDHCIHTGYVGTGTCSCKSNKELPYDHDHDGPTTPLGAAASCHYNIVKHVTFKGNSEIWSHKTGGRLIQV